jgi:hypothetical protein
MQGAMLVLPAVSPMFLAFNGCFGGGATVAPGAGLAALDARVRG